MRYVVVLLLACSLLFTAAGAADEAGSAWPRELQHEKGSVIIYQPQVETLEGDTLRARAAVSVTMAAGDTGPIFGVIWLDARVLTDRDARTVRVVSIDVTDVRFPEITEDQKTKFASFVESRVEEWEMTISLDRLLASLAVVEEERDLAEGLRTKPPTVLYSDVPAVLILIDGKPWYKSIEDGDLQRLANSPYTIVHDPKKKKYYLDGGLEWYVADDVMGPWAVIKKPPKKVRKLRSEEAAAAAKKAHGSDEYKPPLVIVAIEPTELIVTDGKAEYAPIQGATALYVMNAENDILLDVVSQEHFVLFSGRWYRAKKMAGPWVFVASDSLPDSFLKIPADSPHGHLRVSIAGTDEAREALADNSIPQTSAVNRGAATLNVEYDGLPKFTPIEGTQMEYAINTSFSVLKIDGIYWVCHQAVWYKGVSPEGPWAVADSRPDQVSQIPPENPHYNTKYVYVYDSTPEVVYVGYTPGYVGSYAYGGCVVYGTGWYYPAWHGSYYYPHHATWGFNVRYNPWYGWGVGVSWSNGPFTISIGYGGGYGYPHSYWGPGGYAFVPVPVYGRRPAYPVPGYRPGTRPGINPPAAGRPSIQPVGNGNNLYNRPENRNRTADLKRPGTQQDRAANRPNDVFAGPDGNVYRRDNKGSWQQRSGGDWKGTNTKSQGLDRDHRGRTRGTQRSGSFRGASSFGGARGGRR